MNLIPVEIIERKIYLIRGQKVMMDRDLARLYGVATKVLNQAVKRNLKRFPKDFMFQLTQSEKNELVTNCDRFNPLKHSTSAPFAFTEQGVAMLSSVLNSEQAIEVHREHRVESNLNYTFYFLKSLYLSCNKYSEKICHQI